MLLSIVIVCIPLVVDMSMMELINSSMIMMRCIPLELNKLDMNPSFVNGHIGGAPKGNGFVMRT